MALDHQHLPPIAALGEVFSASPEVQAPISLTSRACVVFFFIWRPRVYVGTGAYAEMISNPT